MRIAMISTPFIPVPPRDYGGTELVVHELVEGLVERGHEVTLFATGDSTTTAELQILYPRAQWPPDPLTDLDHVSWALRRVAMDRFDVVHVHSAAALAAARFLPRPSLVYTLHHAREERLSRFYRHFLQTHYVAISADQMRREIPLARCEVIHHGLDPSRYAWSPVAGDYVCFAGRLAREKGPHTAIDVAQRAGLPIRVAGRVHPQDRDYGQRELDWRLGLPHVSFLGCVDVTSKIPLLRDARALLAPIEWNEPFGLILIEAMLSGAPVVAFRRGSIPELVEPGVTGYVVDTPEEMTEVIRKGGPLDRFDRARCRARAEERFSNSRMLEDYERLYRRVIEEMAPGRKGRSARVA